MSENEEEGKETITLLFLPDFIPHCPVVNDTTNFFFFYYTRFQCTHIHTIIVGLKATTLGFIHNSSEKK